MSNFERYLIGNNQKDTAIIDQRSINEVRSGSRVVENNQEQINSRLAQPTSSSSTSPHEMPHIFLRPLLNFGRAKSPYLQGLGIGIMSSVQ